MESPRSSPPPMSFCDFPEDVQVAVLSFLRPAEIAAFACTSKRFAFLCAQDRLWFTMCDRRWGSKTDIRSWMCEGRGSASFAVLYKMLDRWENLLGFWRRIGRRGDWGCCSLVFFEWGPCFITGSVVAQSPDSGSYKVLKVPFLWTGLSPRGEALCFVRPTRFFEPSGYAGPSASILELSDSDFLPATIGFIGENHFVVEEKQSYYGDARDGGAEIHTSDDPSNSEELSFNERFLSAINRHLGNQEMPIRNEATTNGKNRERKHRARRKGESEHMVKIADCYPTPERPLQGLWKGMYESARLAFFLVTYDSMGAISCRRIGDVSEPISGYSPIFWTSSASALQSPFPREEESLYLGREHSRQAELDCPATERIVSQIFRANSSYDLAVVDSSGSDVNYQNVEGRIWLYDDGSFGFGFLRNNFIVDLTQIAMNGVLLDSA